VTIVKGQFEGQKPQTGIFHKIRSGANKLELSHCLTLTPSKKNLSGNPSVVEFYGKED
jgi:hypothetical protein